MEPLREQADSTDPEVAKAARLIASANRPEDSVVAKARVRRAVMARLSGRAAPPLRSRLRPSVVFGIVLFATSAAAASVTWVVTRYIEDKKQEGEVRAPKGPLVVPEAKELAGRRVARGGTALDLNVIPGIDVVAVALDADSLVASVGPASPTGLAPMPPMMAMPRVIARRVVKNVAAPAAEPTVIDDATDPVVAEAPTPIAPPAPVVVAEPAKEKIVAQAPVEAIAAPVAPAPAPEPAKPQPAREPEVDNTPDAEVLLLQSAFSALRREGNPKKAARALDSYLRQYPRGKLAEEALGLSIEAYASMDDARAAERAASYLARYPEGRYRTAAARALERFPQ